MNCLDCDLNEPICKEAFLRQKFHYCRWYQRISVDVAKCENDIIIQGNAHFLKKYILKYIEIR